jgi:hypothetical protein
MVWRCVVGDVVVDDGCSCIAVDSGIIGDGRENSGAATRDGDIIGGSSSEPQLCAKSATPRASGIQGHMTKKHKLSQQYPNPTKCRDRLKGQVGQRQTNSDNFRTTLHHWVAR